MCTSPYALRQINGSMAANKQRHQKKSIKPQNKQKQNKITTKIKQTNKQNQNKTQNKKQNKTFSP